MCVLSNTCSGGWEWVDIIIVGIKMTAKHATVYDLYVCNLETTIIFPLLTRLHTYLP